MPFSSPQAGSSAALYSAWAVRQWRPSNSDKETETRRAGGDGRLPGARGAPPWTQTMRLLALLMRAHPAIPCHSCTMASNSSQSCQAPHTHWGPACAPRHSARSPPRAWPASASSVGGHPHGQTPGGRQSFNSSTVHHLATATEQTTAHRPQRAPPMSVLSTRS